MVEEEERQKRIYNPIALWREWRRRRLERECYRLLRQSFRATYGRDYRGD